MNVKSVLVILFFFFSNTITMACYCTTVGFCESITADSKVVEARLINFYEATNSYNRYVDIEITSLLYGLDTLAYDTLTIIDYFTDCDLHLYSWAEIGDKFVFMFEELEVEEEANYLVFNLDVRNIKYLQLSGDSISGVFYRVFSWFDANIDTIEYEYFMNDLVNTCELLQLNTSSIELTNGISFSIFPNPAQENLSIQINPVRDATYLIYSSTGKIIESRKTIEQSNFNVDIGHFSSGIYYVQIQMEAQTFNKKIIKL